MASTGLTMVAVLLSLQADAGRGTENTVTEPDVAASYADAVDGAEVMMSPKHYRAVRAVERYREGAQARALTASEREFMNFDIHIPGADLVARDSWLTAAEKKTCYLVELFPRYQPGEKVVLDSRPRAGRIARYAVRKSDFTVVRAALAP
jgi:hypothetical protein